MFFNPGMMPNEIGDFEIIEHEGKLHVFYLTLSNHDTVGHLVGDDGLNWQALPPAIRTGDPGSFDDDQIWTMGVFKRGDEWVMLYTANQQNGLYQVTGQAVSKDLIHWEKPEHNPVAEPDARWYETKLGGHYRTDWRDPHIVFADGKYHAFLCARQNEGPRNHRGCAGYFTSEDGYTWDVQPPASTPNNCWDYECPSVFQIKDKWYMVAIHGGHDRTTYRIADKVSGPYRRPFDDSLTPYRNMSVRPSTFRGDVHLFHWNRGPADWVRKYGVFSCICSPKQVRADDEGNLTVESFDWSGQYAGEAAPLNTSTGNAAGGDWQNEGDALVGTSEFGTACFLTKQDYEDVEITAEVELDNPRAACEFGIVIRGDEQADQAIYARCIPGRSAAELTKQIYNRKAGPDSMWRGRTVEEKFHITPSADGKYHLRVIAWGPNIEVNINHRLTNSWLTMPRRAGRFGVFLEDGKATFKNVKITPLKTPQTNWDY